jgi:hypothetical protein
MKMSKDNQIVELAGRNRLASELQRAGIEVARPERDHGVDLVAFLDSDRFRARPIQLKGASRENFEVQRKYERFSELMLVYVWNLDLPISRFFALSYPEATEICEAMGWTSTRSWQGKTKAPPGFGTRKPSPKLKGLLSEYEIKKPEQWLGRIFPGQVPRAR